MNESEFNKITPEIYEALKNIVGDKYIYTEKFDLEPYVAVLVARAELQIVI